MVLLLIPGAGSAQSTNPDSPTAIASFPVTGNLGSGTYYYQLPESLVSEGEATATLTFTPPDGGGSMTASFSGPRCCSGEVTVGDSTGYAEAIRRSTTFSIPGQQNILVTVYVSVAPKRTVRFNLNLTTTGGPSGIIITPPPTTPTTPTGPVCTDLGINGFAVNSVTSMRNKISGIVLNVTTTHPYKGYGRRQWLVVRDITDSETRPRLVTRIFIPEIVDPGESFSYAVVDTLPKPRLTRYEIMIGYSHLNSTDDSQYNDDCNSRNNITRRVLIGPFPYEENRSREATEAVPVQKP